MEKKKKNSPRYKDDSQSLLPSPSITKTLTQPITTISKSTTFVQTDPASFKQVVQMLTGCSSKPNYPPPNSTHQPDPRYSFPPIRPVPNKNQLSSSSGFRIYERRNSKTHFEIDPVFNPVHAGLPVELTPGVPDFPGLILSPDTTLLPDPFYQPGSKIRSPTRSGFGPYDPRRGSDVEEREIREKGFYLHPSPSSDSEPRLLHLFPLTSPRASESLPNST